MRHHHRAPSAGSGSLATGSCPLRASTAHAGKRGNLPAIHGHAEGIQQKSAQENLALRERLGYHGGWGPAGGTARWGPGALPGNSNSGRNLKSAGTCKRTGGLTQILMFPTPAHVVRPVSNIGNGSLSAASLPQVDAEPKLQVSSSAPALTGITEWQLVAAEKARAQTADVGGINFKLHWKGATADHTTAASSPARRLKGAAPVTFEFDEGGENGSFSDSGDLEQNSGAMSSEQSTIEHNRSKKHRRTFHHTYSCGSLDTEGLDLTDDFGSGQQTPLLLTARSKDPKDEAAEESRESFRRELLRAAGCGPERAFRSIDLNQNGQLSLQEFGDGMSRLCVRWQEASSRKTLKEVFKLFVNKDGIITLLDLFPETTHKMTEPNRMSTPDFWTYWCRSSPKDEDSKKRGPKWQAADQDEELQSLFAATATRQDVTERKRWVSQTFRRMKSQGKTDARCREMCARHLPRGTGPRDEDYVPAFSNADVKSCRREYSDAVSIPVRNIQKQVYAMREQRLDLHSAHMEMKRMNQRNVQVCKQRSHSTRLSHGNLDIPDDILDVDCDEHDEDVKRSLGVDCVDNSVEMAAAMGGLFKQSRVTKVRFN